MAPAINTPIICCPGPGALAHPSPSKTQSHHFGESLLAWRSECSSGQPGADLEHQFTSNGRQHVTQTTAATVLDHQGADLGATPEADKRGGGRAREETSNQRHRKRRLGGGEVRVQQHGFPPTEVLRCQSGASDSDRQTSSCACDCPATKAQTRLLVWAPGSPIDPSKIRNQ